MTTSNDIDSSHEWAGRLSPSDVHNVLFTRAGLGRRGYDEVEVDVFLERVQQELTRLIGEKADLRDEVSRLRTQLAQASSAPAADGALSTEEANLQAVRLLAAAQQTADVYVADAEKYSQRLTVDAREHSEQILEEARRSAQRLLAEAERTAGEAAARVVDGRAVDGTAIGAPALSQQELDEQVAYLKTFGQVVRVQLKAYLEALLRDVEEEWGKADPAVMGSQPSDRAPAAPTPSAVAPALVAPVEEPSPDAAAPSGATAAQDADEDSDQPADAAPPPRSNGSGPPRARKRTTVNLHSR